jgi:hypothetical protein
LRGERAEVEWREWRKGSGGRELEKGVEEKARQESNVPATAMILIR